MSNYVYVFNSPTNNSSPNGVFAHSNHPRRRSRCQYNFFNIDVTFKPCNTKLTTMGNLPKEGTTEPTDQPLDFSASSGSVGNSHFADGPTENDGRQRTATTFRPQEAESNNGRWERLNNRQDGKLADDVQNRSVMSEQHRDLKLFSERAELTSWEKKYAKCLLDALQRKMSERHDSKPITKETDHEKGYDFENPEKYVDEDDTDESKSGGDKSFYQNTETLLLAIITYAANKNDRRIRQNDSFIELQNNLNVSTKELRSERQNIREQM